MGAILEDEDGDTILDSNSSIKISLNNLEMNLTN